MKSQFARLAKTQPDYRFLIRKIRVNLQLLFVFLCTLFLLFVIFYMINMWTTSNNKYSCQNLFIFVIKILPTATSNTTVTLQHPNSYVNFINKLTQKNSFSSPDVTFKANFCFNQSNYRSICIWHLEQMCEEFFNCWKSALIVNHIRKNWR